MMIPFTVPQTKTFSEHRADGYNYPEGIDELTQSLLDDFFALRRIIPHFDLLFDRDLKLFYPQFKQMLRIDPTVLDVDWFVQNYVEREVRDNKTENGESTVSANDTKSTSLSGDATITNSGKDKITLTDVIDETDYPAVETTEENSGSFSKDTKNENENKGSERNMGHARQAPMSSEYTVNDLEGLITDPTVEPLKLDASFVSAMQTNANVMDFAKPKILNPTASEDHVNLSSSVSGNKAHESGTDGYTKTTTDSGTFKRAGTNTHTTENEIDNSQTNEHSQEGTETTERSQTTNNSLETSNVNREVMTGRNAFPSEVIERAKACIISSNSCRWLIKALDRNFIQSYETEDYIYE